MRVGILTTIVLSSTIGWMPSASAQVTPQEHEGLSRAKADRTSPQEPRAGMSSGRMPGMMGREDTTQTSSPGMSMSRMMRGPDSTE